MRLARELPIRLLTHNIRYATNETFKGEEAWAVRAPRMISELEFHTMYVQESFICMQEVLHNQLVDIVAGLNGMGKFASAIGGASPAPLSRSTAANTWSYIGVGREDGKEEGEYSPILYKPAVWRLNTQ